jgi:hypothetical protein
MAALVLGSFALVFLARTVVARIDEARTVLSRFSRAR